MPRDDQKSDMPRLISRAEVAKILGVGRATISRYEQMEEFPRRVNLPGGAVRYVAGEISSYIETRRA